MKPERAAPPEEADETTRAMTHDPHTGLPNRFLLTDRLEFAIAQAQRYEHLSALVVIDLNKTTEVRAALGLDAGEELTRMVSEHLKCFVRKSDTLACIGSDLFAIVMPQVRDLPQILGLTIRLMKLFDGPWELAGQSLHLTPGVGVACYPENGEEAGELIAHAVTAAAHAAQLGEHRPRVADPAWQEEARRRIALEADLRRALEREEFRLYYQPQVSAETGCISGFEALARWQHPQHGMVSPGEFIPLAEETRLILPIGEWVIEEACAQLARWREAGHAGVRVSVNLAAQQLAQDIVPLQVRNALAARELDPRQFEVELTESSAIADTAATGRALEKLKELGVRVTLDDFGTGYSSTLLLAQYPFDTLKIDRSFVMRVFDGPKERALTTAIIALAHAVGMTVVAEGVETRAQLTLLHELGADEIQGFFFAPPLAAQECEPFLAGRCNVTDGRLAS
jgi:diguanylate cyclase (GGDEF)-like protein